MTDRQTGTQEEGERARANAQRNVGKRHGSAHKVRAVASILRRLEKLLQLRAVGVSLDIVDRAPLAGHVLGQLAVHVNLGLVLERSAVDARAARKVAADGGGFDEEKRTIAQYGQLPKRRVFSPGRRAGIVENRRVVQAGRLKDETRQLAESLKAEVLESDLGLLLRALLHNH